MKNLLGQIAILKAMEIKPNFSELAREYGVDKRTVKKYYEGYEGKPKRILNKYAQIILWN